MGALNIDSDLQAGYDLAISSTITKDQIAQAINQLKPLSNIGGVLYFSSENGTVWPGVTTNPRLKRYIWIDSYTNPVKLKVYDKSEGDEYANWVEITGTGGGGSVEVYEFVSTWTLPAESPWCLSIAHNLGTTPKLVRPVLYCAYADAGYSLGEEIDFYTGYFISGASGFPIANISVTNSLVNVIFAADYTERRIFHKTTGEVTTINNALWKVKVYLTK